MFFLVAVKNNCYVAEKQEQDKEIAKLAISKLEQAGNPL